MDRLRYGTTIFSFIVTVFVWSRSASKTNILNSKPHKIDCLNGFTDFLTLPTRPTQLVFSF